MRNLNVFQFGWEGFGSEQEACLIWQSFPLQALWLHDVLLYIQPFSSGVYMVYMREDREVNHHYSIVVLCIFCKVLKEDSAVVAHISLLSRAAIPRESTKIRNTEFNKPDRSRSTPATIFKHPKATQEMASASVDSANSESNQVMQLILDGLSAKVLLFWLISGKHTTVYITLKHNSKQHDNIKLFPREINHGRRLFAALVHISKV